MDGYFQVFSNLIKFESTRFTLTGSMRSEKLKYLKKNEDGNIPVKHYWSLSVLVITQYNEYKGNQFKNMTIKPTCYIYYVQIVILLTWAEIHDKQIR